MTATLNHNLRHDVMTPTHNFGAHTVLYPSFNYLQ